MYHTIFFDLDGTLIPFLQDEFVHTYFQDLIQCVAPLGYDGERTVAALWKGVAAMVGNDGERTNREVFWDCFAQELGEKARELERVLNSFYAGAFDRARCVLREKADRGPLIRSLREKGYGLVLATNPVFPAVAVETRLRWVGLAPEDFDCVTAYESSRHSKPNPAYYRDILAQIGREGSECLMIGNNPVDDMAAQKAGLAVYLVTDCLENPEGVDISAYPHGTFQELEAYLHALPHRSATISERGTPS